MKRKRMLRPAWLEHRYLVGNEKNGYECSTWEIEQWEKEIPCNYCGAIDTCRVPCLSHNIWLDNHPFKKIGKRWL